MGYTTLAFFNTIYINTTACVATRAIQRWFILRTFPVLSARLVHMVMGVNETRCYDVVAIIQQSETFVKPKNFS